ncbi:MAG: TIGR00730 family Rossman fold protein [Acutalibacteraceae bacterium]|nr:TIGR00730 family Rossman fold protein [Acutalibacteraceae bacterium]
MRICVYGAASPTIDNIYKEKVEYLGKVMVQRGHSLVFGGGGNGLMGAVANGVHSAGGHIIGVIPQFFLDEKIEEVCDFCDEMITTETMRERKQVMEDNAEAFIIAPGGIGTYEEFFEILTLKQLCRHNKPIVIYNIEGYYNEIDIAMKEAMKKNFIKDSCVELYVITDDLDKLFEYIENPQQRIRTVKELKDG